HDSADFKSFPTRRSSDLRSAKAGGTGESGGDVVKRVNDFFNEMLQKHHGQLILVVAHNGVNRLYMAEKLGMPLSNYRSFDIENSSITYFELHDDGRFVLKKLNAQSL